MRQRVAPVGRLERVALWLAALARVAVWPFLFAVAAGSGAWALAHPERLAAMANNKLSHAERLATVDYIEVALSVLVFVYAARAVADRVLSGRFQLFDSARWLNRRGMVLLALPLVAALMTPRIEQRHTLLTLLFIGIVTWLVGATVAWATPQGAHAPGRSRLGAWLGPLLLLSLFVGYALFFSRLSITNHWALNTRAFDLGIYDNIFFQSIHGRPLDCTLVRSGNHISAHFDPLLVLLSPLYLLYPRAELLLVLQSVWLAQGVVPAYLLGKHWLTTRGAGLALSLVYALHPALHGANMYEFHSLTLAAPLLLWLVYFLERGALKRYYLLFVLLILVREDIPLLLCFVGGYALLTRRPELARAGWVTIIVSLVYFGVVKGLVMPSAEKSYSYAYYYKDLIPNDQGVWDILLSLVTNPAYVLQHVATEKKLTFFAVVFAPLLFLPALVPRARFMLLYGLLFCGLASRRPVYSTAFQYSVVLFPLAIAITPHAMRRLLDSPLGRLVHRPERAVRRAVLSALLTASVLCSWKFGAVVDNGYFRGGFRPLIRELDKRRAERYAWMQEMIAKIPKDARVTASDVTGAHLSNRRYIYRHVQDKRSDYVLIDERELRGARLKRHRKQIREGTLHELGRFEKVALFEVRAKPERNQPDARRRDPDAPLFHQGTPGFWPAPRDDKRKKPAVPKPRHRVTPRLPGMAPGDGR